MQPEWPRMESSIHEKTRHGMRYDGLAIDRSDQYTLVTAGPHAILPSGGKEVGKS